MAYDMSYYYFFPPMRRLMVTIGRIRRRYDDESLTMVNPYSRRSTFLRVGVRLEDSVRLCQRLKKSVF